METEWWKQSGGIRNVELERWKQKGGNRMVEQNGGNRIRWKYYPFKYTNTVIETLNENVDRYNWRPDRLDVDLLRWRCGVPLF